MSSDPTESIELTDLEAGAAYSPTRPQGSSSNSTRSWHPKITPYRALSLLLPASLGTVKAIASQQGRENEPITLEWISGVVVFIVLFNTGTYERKPIQHIPLYLAWLFKYDCMDAAWWVCSKLSRGKFARPQYISDEVDVEEHGTIYIVTAYRLLVCATIVTIGLAKAGLTYSGVSTGATWVEWILGVFISSVLYIIGLYESNTIGLWPSFFGTDRAYVVRTGLNGTSKLLFILTSILLMSLWFIINRSSIYDSPDSHTNNTAELPVVLRAYNQSIKIMIEGVFVTLFLLGAVVFGAALRNVREEVGDRIRVPLRVRVFFFWITALPSFLFFSASRRAPSLIAILAATPTTLRHIIHTLRHLLFFALSAFLIVVTFSFSVGQGYRLATGDLELKDKQGEKRGKGWHVVFYAAVGLAGTVVVVPAGVVLVWSAREMGRAVARVWVGRWVPAVRRGVTKVKEGLTEWCRVVKRRMNDAAGPVILRLAGLGEVENAHYAFLEFVWTLRADFCSIEESSAATQAASIVDAG